MQITKRYFFSPPLWATCAMILVFSLFCLLGRWQLHRFAEKLSLQTRFALRTTQKPLTLTELTDHDQDLLYYPLQVSGHFDPHYQFLLDNQTQGTQIGYAVLTLFHPLQQKPAILINRGFIPANPNRRILPTLPDLTTATVTLTGRIALPPKRIFALGDIVDTPNRWPMRIEALDLRRLQSLLPGSIAPFTLLLNADQPFGFIRHWQGVATDPYRSLGYAWQWFGFAFTLIIIYIALNLKRTRTPA